MFSVHSHFVLTQIAANVTGGIYSSVNEQRLDEELEAARHVRDKLGGAVEQWRTASNLLRASAQSALIASKHWNSIERTK